MKIPDNRENRIATNVKKYGLFELIFKIMKFIILETFVVYFQISDFRRLTSKSFLLNILSK